MPLNKMWSVMTLEETTDKTAEQRKEIIGEPKNPTLPCEPDNRCSAGLQSPPADFLPSAYIRQWVFSDIGR